MEIITKTTITVKWEDIPALLQKHATIVDQQREDHDQAEFCLFCLEYLFTDTPDNDDCVRCENCGHWYHIKCAEKLKMKIPSGEECSEMSECIYCI